MRQGQTFQTRVRHQRSVGRYKSPYQRGGTIVSPPFNPWTPHTFDEMYPWLQRRMRKQRGGKVHKVIYRWKNKGRKRIKRQRKRR